MTSDAPWDLAVVGGGIAGLAAAWRAHQLGWRVLVLEAGRVVGGKMRSEIKDGYLVEHGQWHLRPTDTALWQLISEVGLDDQVLAAPPSASRFVYRDRALRTRPNNLAEVLTGDSISSAAKLRLLAEPVIPGDAQPDDTVWSFGLRRLGEEATSYLLGPEVVDGFAGDVRQLGARDALGPLWQWEHDAGSLALGVLFGGQRRSESTLRRRRPGIYALRDGMGSLPKGLAAALPDQSVHCSAPVQAMQRLPDGRWRLRLNAHAAEGPAEFTALRVIVATPPRTASELLHELSPRAAAELADVHCVRLAVVHVGAPADAALPAYGIGVVFPPGAGLRTLALGLPSTCFAGRAPAGHSLYTGILGGALDPEAADLSDETLVSLVERAYGVAFSPERARPAAATFHSVVRWRDALPQFRVGHMDSMQLAQHSLSTDCLGLALAGNYLHGVGAAAAAASGMAAVEQLAGEPAPAKTNTADRERK